MAQASHESQDGGNEMIAAELLWGAFAHCLIAVAQNEGLPHDSHGAFTRIAQHLDAAQGGNTWRSHFGSADQLHQHFYHGDLTTQELRTHTSELLLGQGLFEEIKACLEEQGMALKEGAIVDATIIQAPSSTKNREGKQYYFGMKAHIGGGIQRL